MKGHKFSEIEMQNLAVHIDRTFDLDFEDQTARFQGRTFKFGHDLWFNFVWKTFHCELSEMNAALYYLQGIYENT